MLQFRPRGGVSGGDFAGVSRVVSHLLRSRGVDTQEKAERFLSPTLDQLWDPFLMQDMEKAVSLIQFHIASGHRIQVYGDYDTDGVSATSVMLTLFRRLHAKADYRIPSRHSEGYGLNCDAVREIAKDHALLITVDCGITNHEEVRLAKELGMDVIVTDHHQLPKEPVGADAILNPLCGDYPFRRLCGAGVAMKIVQAMLGMDGVMEVIDLAALATVADLVPLIDENRVIVTFGMREMEKGLRPGLKEMMERVGCTLPMTSSQVAFRLAPRINAGGRLEDAGQCVELLVGEDDARISLIAKHLEENNSLRQEMQREIIDSVRSKLSETVDFGQDLAIVVMGEEWNTGVIGLAAGRICEDYHMPTIVLSHLEDRAVGSCRSIPGVNIHALLTRCADLFQRFGGHEQAAGLTMDPTLVPELRRRLNLYIRESCDPQCFIPFDYYDEQLGLGEVTLDLIEELGRMEPTGFGNPAPVFLLRDGMVQHAQAVGKDAAHLKLSLAGGGEVRDAIAFRQGKLAGTALGRIDCLFSPQRNEFRGVVKPQLQIDRIRGAQGVAAVPEALLIFPHLLQELRSLTSKEITIPERVQVEGRRALTGIPVRGTLLIVHTESAARDIASRVEADVALGRIEDPRPFTTMVVCPEYDRLRDVWETVIFADGCVLPGEAEAVHAMCPRAQLQAMPGDALRAYLRALPMPVEQLRQVFVKLREHSVTAEIQVRFLADMIRDMPERVFVALEALHECGLAEVILEPFAARVISGSRADPMATPIMRCLNTI
ncbi:MAG: single-stranded-DNA-specific exonuclease RecJ [Clostridia bacterium]|nr:single-stranded-DNA-specific exonuclease RecJ [Clostridia bacterium]